MTLREEYFKALKQSQKQLVSKSALGPDIYAVRNQVGEIIGFAPGERLSADEIAALKTEVAKSAENQTDNSIFDNLFDFRPALHTSGVEEVSKSADTDEADLLGIFPAFLQPSQ